jgi:RNA polymerase sigma-70 factor (ECF subfamily)
MLEVAAAPAANVPRGPMQIVATPISDHSLLQRTGTGDRDAFLELYDRFAPRMLGVIAGVLHDRHGAEDVLQRVMLEVWQRYAARYDPSLGAVDTWMFRLARSRAIDELRSVQRRRFTPSDQVENATDQREDHAGAGPSDAGRAARIRRSIRELPDDERVPIELAYVQGLSREQIAQHCAVPVGTIKTRIRRGLVKLQEQLADLVAHSEADATDACRIGAGGNS